MFVSFADIGTGFHKPIVLRPELPQGAF